MAEPGNVPRRPGWDLHAGRPRSYIVGKDHSADVLA